MPRRTRYSREFRKRAVSLVFEQVGQYASQWEAICSVAAKVNVSSETLRKWVRQAEVDAGTRPGISSEESAEVKRLRWENTELRRANAATPLPNSPRVPGIWALWPDAKSNPDSAQLRSAPWLIILW